jgi:hypothetical protein
MVKIKKFPRIKSARSELIDRLKVIELESNFIKLDRLEPIRVPVYVSRKRRASTNEIDKLIETYMILIKNTSETYNIPKTHSGYGSASTTKQAWDEVGKLLTKVMIEKKDELQKQ